MLVDYVRYWFDEWFYGWTRGMKIALAVFAMCLLVYTSVITAIQDRSFREYVESQPEMVSIQCTDGTIHQVPKSEYEQVNAEYREKHPEEYGIFQSNK